MSTEADRLFLEAMQETLVAAWRYPELGARRFIERIAHHLDCPADRVAVGSGSLDLLDRMLLAYVAPGDEVVLGWRSYEAYPISVAVAGGRPVLVALRPNGAMDLDAMLEAISPSTRLVLLCSPNNPTGVTTSWAEIRRFLDRVPDRVLVVVDQAYIEFSSDDAARQSLYDAAERANVVLLRTFSKAYGLAGLRVGYAYAAGPVIRAVTAVSPPFPVSAIGMAAATWALDHPDLTRDRVARVRIRRSELNQLLREFDVPHLRSGSNFVWLALGERAAQFAHLCGQAGISVRAWPEEGVRISVGHPDLNHRLVTALERFRDEG